VIIFTILFIATLGYFAVIYGSIWSKLNNMKNDKPAAWLFVLLTWLGYSIGSLTCSTFFRSVSSLKMRGLVILGMWVPVTLYESYLHWAYFNNEDSSAFAQVFVYLGATLVSLIFGVGLGLLFTFQGIFVSVFSGATPGMISGLANAFLPVTYILCHFLLKWTNEERVTESDAKNCPKDKFDGIL